MSPYLYDQYKLGEDVVPNGNTKRRLSVIEITSIIGVTVSAAILLVNVWNVINPRPKGRGFVR